jgi:glycosyltransferase involved in cell wall biosynthesis
MDLTYDVVIATRNRPFALEQSLPLLLTQTRRPRAIVVVDSSDEPDSVKHVLDSLSVPQGVRIVYEHSAPGASLQRNRALEFVSSEVAFFLDDDSLLYHDAAEKIMRVYERDQSGEIGAVCAAEARTPPTEARLQERHVYRKSVRDRFKLSVARIRKVLEEKLVPDPFVILGNEANRRFNFPKWFAEEDVTPVQYMTGFRMTFRSELIKELRFSESLGAYALFEDIEASLRALRSHMVVGARRARIYHHMWPGKRGSGHELGMMQILNRARIVCLLSPPSSAARRALRTYTAYKLLQYLSLSCSSWWRSRLQGAASAAAQLRKLIHAPCDQIDAIYLVCRSDCGGHKAV